MSENIKVEFYVSKRFPGDKFSSVYDFTTLEMGKNLIEENFWEWLFEQIDCGWHIIDKEDA